MKPPGSAGVRSMTGQGRAQRTDPLGTCRVEIRSVNHRGLKCSVRTGESLATLASKLESHVRSRIHRGSVNINATWRSSDGNETGTVCQEALLAYFQQLQSAQHVAGVDQPIDWVGLLQLPGVIRIEDDSVTDSSQVWGSVRQTVDEAIEQMDQMRRTEGRAMALSLQTDLAAIRDRISTIEQLAPRATDRFRGRLEGKIQRTLVEHDLTFDRVDLLREVQLYADRVDISEEITRLASHLDLFETTLGSPTSDDETTLESAAEPTGRKLDFIVQEMFRETNTIGSKASDAAISAHVVEIKCGLERIRELVQNLE